MWLSILKHITNCHNWTGSVLFNKCAHERLTADQKKKKKWLKQNSVAYAALHDIVTNKLLLRDMEKITKFCHTGNIEVFHSFLLKYCPKRQYFPYETMKARLMLAALDWNCQKREIITDENDETVQDVVYTKRRRHWILRNRYIIIHTHVDNIMNEIIKHKSSLNVLPPIETPENITLIAKESKPIIHEMQKFSRFGKK